MPTSRRDARSPTSAPSVTDLPPGEHFDTEATKELSPVWAGRPRHRLTWPRRVRWPGSAIAFLWIGLLTTAAGFGVITYTWSKVAALLHVALQVPYLVSGGLTGIGLVLIGLTIVNAAAKHRDAAEQERQLNQLAATVHQLRTLLEADQPDEPETKQ